MKLLFLSNGHGEDLIASLIIKEMKKIDPTASCVCFPIVGEGKAYEGIADEIAGPRRTLPSGGFINRNHSGLWTDLRAGLLNTLWQEITALQALGKSPHLKNSPWVKGESLSKNDPVPLTKTPPIFDKVVACGDMVPLLIAAWFVRRRLRCPLYFIPTAKSAYIAPHLAIEKWLMKRTCQNVFPRDQYTADNLSASGVPVTFCGNVMMDALEVTGETFGIDREKCRVVTFLPGSHFDAYENMVDFFDIIMEVEEKSAKKPLEALLPGTPVVYLLALAPSLSLTDLEDFLLRRRQPERCHPIIRFAPNEIFFKSQPESNLVTGNSAKTGVAEDILLSPDVSIKVIQGKFGDVLSQADIVVGLSGTGNEQAVGLGKPVVAYPGRGFQFNEKFAREQKRLLGDALFLCQSQQETAIQILSLLQNPPDPTHLDQIALSRMGPRGAARSIATSLCEHA